MKIKHFLKALLCLNFVWSRKGHESNRVFMGKNKAYDIFNDFDCFLSALGRWSRHTKKAEGQKTRIEKCWWSPHLFLNFIIIVKKMSPILYYIIIVLLALSLNTPNRKVSFLFNFTIYVQSKMFWQKICNIIICVTAKVKIVNACFPKL